jgi:hypothetical protein
MRVGALVLSGLLAACSPGMLHPTYVPQATSALERVDRAPPPARIEMVPARPSPEAVWVDGEWIWRRGLWAWLPGRWVLPPAGAVLAAWTFVRRADGTLWYAHGTWHGANGAEIDPPAPLALAAVEAGPVVDADGTLETTGPTVRDRPTRKTDAVPADEPQPSAPPRPPPPAPPVER